NEGVTVSEVWLSKKIRNGLGGVVLVGDHLYGTNDRELLCVEYSTGKIKWQNKSVGTGAVFGADGHIYLRGQNGGVAFLEASPDGYREKGRFVQPERTNKPAWPYPVVANGCLYLRDQNLLYCYDVKDSKSSVRE